MSEIEDRFLNIFLDEAQDLLETWEKACLQIDREPSKEGFVELFRVAHNLKGSSASVGLSKFSSFS